MDKAALAMPVFGDLVRKAAVAKFTRTLGTLISSGVPILDSLDIVAKTAGNKVVENGILYTKHRISEGKSIAGPLMEAGVFPKMVVQMIAVGESTGAMDVMLVKIADFYDEEVEQAVDGITSLIEPLIMVVLGGIIGFVLIAMYMPIFSMADNLALINVEVSVAEPSQRGTGSAALSKAEMADVFPYRDHHLLVWCDLRIRVRRRASSGPTDGDESGFVLHDQLHLHPLNALSGCSSVHQEQPGIDDPHLCPTPRRRIARQYTGQYYRWDREYFHLLFSLTIVNSAIILYRRGAL